MSDRALDRSAECAPERGVALDDADLRNDLIALTFLVESLYFCHFKTRPHGVHDLERFRADVRESYVRAIGGERPITESEADVDAIFRAISASLSRVQARLSD